MRIHTLCKREAQALKHMRIDILYKRGAKALTNLRTRAGSSEPSLFADEIHTKYVCWLVYIFGDEGGGDTLKNLNEEYDTCDVVPRQLCGDG